MGKKTEQALKIIASWTPHEDAAKDMLQAVALGGSLVIASGRLSIHAAVACDFAEPGSAEKAAKRVQAIKAELESTGTLHGFSATAGAVPVGTAERVS